MQKRKSYHPDDDDDPLCCCEYLSVEESRRRHILQFCCDCILLDDICERCLRCETVPIGRFYKLFAVMLDRVRLPSPGGAVRLTWKHVLPFVVYPVLVYSGAYGAFICALGFLLVLYGLTLYSQFMFTKKQKNTVVGCFIWAYLVYTYLLYLWYLYPMHDIPQSWLAVQHVLICVFVLSYVLTLAGPGFVPIRSGDDQEQITYLNQSEIQINGVEAGETVEDTYIKVDEITGNLREIQPTNEFYKFNPEYLTASQAATASKLPPGSLHMDARLMQEKPEMEADELETGCGVYWPVLRSDWFYCTVCKMLVPPQSVHCRTCDRCVYELDHHCFWLDCCVGLQNKRWFMLLLVSLVGGNLFNAYMVFFTICPLSPNSGDGDGRWYCKGIFQQKEEMRYVFVSTLYGLLVGIYQVYPSIRMFISISMSISLVRIQKYIKSKMLNRMSGKEPLSYRWLNKYNRGFYRNWVRVLYPPSLWELPTKPPPMYQNV
ncbi:palmitoyltransferase ZDHHC23-B-like [Convolutriloba macropyga]|uniref:palmitoyltransferase ZDHHC23-B-like n=1 Tax=Convolutriloba macropyga TaxID=536237 RepID=UPI003F51F0DE